MNWFWKESASLAERLIQGQVVNAQNGESIDQLKNNNKKLLDRISEYEANSYENSIVSNNFNEKINEIQILNEKLKSLVEVLMIFSNKNKKKWLI